MFELIVTVYLAAAGNQVIIDRQPVRVLPSEQACLAAAASAVAAGAQANARVVAFCAPTR